MNLNFKTINLQVIWYTQFNVQKHDIVYYSFYISCLLHLLHPLHHVHLSYLSHLSYIFHLFLLLHLSLLSPTSSFYLISSISHPSYRVLQVAIRLIDRDGVIQLTAHSRDDSHYLSLAESQGGKEADKEITAVLPCILTVILSDN